MKVALVTGAYKGLGFEWCRQLGKNGYKVILTAWDFNKAQEAAEHLTEQQGLKNVIAQPKFSKSINLCYPFHKHDWINSTLLKPQN